MYSYIYRQQAGRGGKATPAKWLQMVVWPAPKVNTVKSLRRALWKLVYRYLDSCHIDRPTLQMQRSAASHFVIVQIKLTEFGHKSEEKPRGRTRCSTLNIRLTCVLLLSLYHGHWKPLTTSNIKFCSCRPLSNSVKSHILMKQAYSEFGKARLHRRQHE